MNKLRSDSAFCQLTSEQTEALEGWLFEERLGYPQVLARLKAEFGLETSLTGVRRFYKRLEMERLRQSLMDAMEMGELATEALKSGTLKPGMLALANKCAVELMMQSPPPVREVTALLRAITSAEGHAMKQTVFEREENERREAERVRKARESWRLTPQDIEEEKEELRQERAAKRKARQGAERAAKEREDSGVVEAKAEGGCAEPLPTPEPTGSKEPAHPLSPASDEGEGGSSRRLDATSLTSIPLQEPIRRGCVSEGGSGLPTSLSPSPRPNGFPSPPPVSCPERDVRFAQSGPQGEGDTASVVVGIVRQPSAPEEREYAENYPAEEAENRLTPLNAA